MDAFDDDFDDDCLVDALDQADALIPKPKHIECLQSNFGHKTFRPKQWDIVRSIIEERRDQCVIMPTGYGKSLLFQYPAVYTNGITLVVSPLISLMQDQVRSLSVANIPACFLGSAQTDRTIEQRARDNEFRLVYVSPEYISGECGTHLLQSLENKLTLVAIDEAHCVSQWGHDFRTDYRRLDKIRKTVQSVPILAVTATATPHVQNDIVKMLKLNNANVLCMGFDRPNIEFSFKKKSKEVWDDLKPHTTLVRGSVIIYVLKRAVSEQIASILRQNGVTCEIYHAGLPNKKRKEVLEDFTKDRLQVIVATVAFGMGIDKPDVRCVIHYGASKNIETYYQEVGRAGRDGYASKAITFFDSADFTLHEWFLSQNYEHKSESVIQHLRQLGEKMKSFCFTGECRRKFILEYFGSSCPTEKRSKCCDNCNRGSSFIKLSDTYQNIDDDGFYDFTQNAYLLLRAMQITSKQSVAIPVLRGSGEKTALPYKNEREVFGAGKALPKEYWQTLIQQLKQYNYLTLKPLPAPYRPIVVISARGYDWLNTAPNHSMKLKVIPEMLPFLPKKKKIVINNNLGSGDNNNVKPSLDIQSAVSTPAEPNVEVEEMSLEEEFVLSDKQLEEILFGIRTSLAERSDCMPHLVASNMAIEQMVKKKPVSVKEFKASIIDGFSLAKIEKFASAFIYGIIKFMNNELSLDKVLRTYPLKKEQSQLDAGTRYKLQKLIKDNKSIRDIQKALNLSENQVMHEIVILIRSGVLITKTHLYSLVGVDFDMFNHIKELATEDDMHSLDNLDVVKAKFCQNKKITEQILILVLNYLKVRLFLMQINVPYFDVDENKLLNGSALLDKPIDGLTIKRGIEMSTPTAGTSSSASNGIQSPKPSSSGQSIADKLAQFKKVEDKPIVLLPTAKPVEAAKPAKRLIVRAAPKIQYVDDSDSDGENQADQSPQSKRKLPQWLSKKDITKPTTTATAKKFPVKRRNIF